jgi:predicted outer membrane repeat protein
MPLDPRPLQAPQPADPTDLALWRADLAACERDPWRASLFMRRIEALRSRLAELRDWLASLPRRMRRGWARGWGRRWAYALPAGALLLALAAGQARAATITVDPGGSGCTLQDAIIAANTDTATGSCPAGDLGADTINFATANGTYLIDSNYGVALPTINTEITIQGNGNTTLDAEGMFRVLTVDLGGSLGIANATITGGSAADGGGIYVAGGRLSLTSTTISGNTAVDNGGGIYAISSTVSLTGATISGNTADDRGGGIYARASTVSLTSATIRDNTADGLGGGIMAISGGSLSLVGTTVSDNSADSGGGAFLSVATSVQNSTISGNSTSSRAGGILTCCNTLALIHTTITGNSAGSGVGGVYGVTFALIDSQSSIIARQTAGADCGVEDITSSFVSNGYNIESATGCGFSMASDQQSVSPVALDLDPLVPNAPGTTETHALGAGSVALDQIPPGTNGCGTTIGADQRGVTRPQGANCDVGAYELEVATPTPTPTPTSTPTPTPMPMPTLPPTAAEVTHFAAAPDPTGRIRITWETASEVDVAGFRLQRAPEGGEAWADVGALVPARGSAASGTRYTATDAPGVGSFAYRLVVVNADGPPVTHGPIGAVVRALRAFLPVGWR